MNIYPEGESKLERHGMYHDRPDADEDEPEECGHLYPVGLVLTRCTEPKCEGEEFCLTHQLEVLRWAWIGAVRDGDTEDAAYISGEIAKLDARKAAQEAGR